MSDLALETTSYTTSRVEWLGSAHGIESAQTVSLDLSAFTEADHFAAGTMPAGIVLGKITASGKYGPYDNAAGDGTETATGFLLHNVPVPTGTTTGERVAAMVDHVVVNEAQLPDLGAMTNGGLDANGKVDLAACRFRP